MRVLLVAATELEIKLLSEECELVRAVNDNMKSYRYNNLEIDILITGIGTTFTTFFLTQALLEKSYFFVVDSGIAGSLSDQYKIGDVVNVEEEEFADLGIEKEREFLTLFESGFLQSNEFPFENRMLKADHHNLAEHLPRVKGITSNISHGRESSIQELKNQFSANVVSMEGAAVFYVCRWLGIPFLQIRSVSNLVVPRSLSRWDIPLALENLKNELLKVLQELSDRVQ
jgi:futalosine hydrolase